MKGPGLYPALSLLGLGAHPVRGGRWRFGDKGWGSKGLGRARFAASLNFFYIEFSVGRPVARNYSSLHSPSTSLVSGAIIPFLRQAFAWEENVPSLSKGSLTNCTSTLIGIVS